jgi:hypothetical protein
LYFIPFRGIFKYGDIYDHHPQGGAQEDTESAEQTGRIIHR